MAQVPFSGARFYENNDPKGGIILLHAYTGSPNDCNLIARKLQQQGYDVLSPLYAGHATKDVFDIVNADIVQWRKETEEAILWMTNRDYASLQVFGLSLGGIFSTWAITQSKFNISAGGIFNSPVMSEQAPDLLIPFKSYTQSVYKHTDRKDEFETDFEVIYQKHLQQMEELDQFRRQFIDKIKHIQRPYFIAQSGQDEMINPEDVNHLLKEVPKEFSHYHYYPNNTHVITVNKNRQQFEHDLFQFIQDNSE